MGIKMVILDRDGVINHDPGDYTYAWENFKVLPGVVESIKYLQEKGVKLVLITNQGGIAKGRYSKEDVDKLHNSFQFYLRKEGARPFHKIYYCPHHDAIENCLCRKPKGLMVEKALADFAIASGEAIFFGDSERDVLAAEAASVKGVKVERNGNLFEAIRGILD